MMPKYVVRIPKAALGIHQTLYARNRIADLYQIVVVNKMQENVSVHWHGIKSVQLHQPSCLQTLTYFENMQSTRNTMV